MLMKAVRLIRDVQLMTARDGEDGAAASLLSLGTTFLIFYLDTALVHEI